MNVHLVDGTYELFRHYFALPKHVNAMGQEVAATRGVIDSILSLIADGATHVAVATDHVIESFRNELWPGYKDSSGIEPDLLSQFPVLEDALRALGVVVWAMERYEADDALAAGARIAAADRRVERVLICTPDKDLAQCVVDRRVIQFDRRRRTTRDAEGVRERFGVSPASIPDYLALVGDSADGYPGLKGWGAKSAGVVLARYDHLERIPPSAVDWDVEVRGADRLAQVLREQRDLASLFRRLATLDADAPVSQSVDALQWHGPMEEWAVTCDLLEAASLVRRADAVASR